MSSSVMSAQYGSTDCQNMSGISFRTIGGVSLRIVFALRKLAFVGLPENDLNFLLNCLLSLAFDDAAVAFDDELAPKLNVLFKLEPVFI